MLKSLLAHIYTLPNESQRFTAMEGLRAYAAFLIFLVHYFDAYGRSALGVDLNTLHVGQEPDVFTSFAYYLFASHYGVDIFFFLSGFLIYRIIRNPEFSYVNFVKSRFLRIYPTFLVSFLIWAYIRIIWQGFPFELSQFLGNLFFLNAVPTFQVQPYNTVTWTLFFEFLFYFSFPTLLLLSPRTGRWRPWHVLGFGMLFVGAVFSYIGPFAIRFVMFFGGALLACLHKDHVTTLAQRIPDSVVLAGYLASTMWFAYLLSYTYFIPVFLMATFFLALKVLYGQGFLRQLFCLQGLRYMGNISFSFYLMHGLALELVMVFWVHQFSGMNEPLFFIMTFGLSLLLSVGLATVLFLLTEKPYFIFKHNRVLSYPQEKTRNLEPIA
jgi:peptidoglycan/LPS O-acetylase OafA/YrhL